MRDVIGAHAWAHPKCPHHATGYTLAPPSGSAFISLCLADHGSTSRVALTAPPLCLAPRKSARPATSGRRVLPSTLIDGRALAHHSRLLERGHLDVELLAPGGLHLLATRRRRRQLNDRSIVLLLLMLGQLELANEAVVGHLWQQPTRHTRQSVASVGAIRRTRRHIRGISEASRRHLGGTFEALSVGVISGNQPQWHSS
jgi:hypothetical protein